MRACHAQPLYALRAGHPPTGLMARPQGGLAAAVFFPLGYRFPYGPGSSLSLRGSEVSNSSKVKPRYNKHPHPDSKSAVRDSNLARWIKRSPKRDKKLDSVSKPRQVPPCTSTCSAVYTLLAVNLDPARRPVWGWPVATRRASLDNS
jgi:hypothetical protein